MGKKHEDQREDNVVRNRYLQYCDFFFCSCYQRGFTVDTRMRVGFDCDVNICARDICTHCCVLEINTITKIVNCKKFENHSRNIKYDYYGGYNLYRTY